MQVFDEHEKDWKVYLDGGRQILSALRSYQSQSTELSFLGSWLYYHHVMGQFTLPDDGPMPYSPLSEPWSDHSIVSSGHGHQLSRRKLIELDSRLTRVLS